MCEILDEQRCEPSRVDTPKRALSLALILVLLPACNVGPRYTRPNVALNATWSERDPRLVTDGAIDIVWWKSFGDPTLDHLIELAYRQNLSLQLAGLRILEARAQLGIAVGEQYPRGGPRASGVATGLSEHAPNSLLLDRRFGDYQVGFDAIWEIDFWGKYRSGVGAAKATYLATVADYDDALVALSAEVARTYVLIRTSEALIELARQNIAVQEEGLQIAQARFTNGATSELDVAQATNLLETTRASVPELQIQLQQTQNALSTLLGRTTGFVRSLLTEPRGIPMPPARVAISVPSEMLRRRPDIRAAELRAMAQCKRIGAAKADLYPRFTLSGSIGTETSTNGGMQSNNSTLADLFGPGSLVYSLGGSVFWPLLNYKQLRNSVRVEDARYQQALVEYIITVLTAAQEVDDGIIGLLRNQDAAVHEQNAVTAADLAVQLSLVQYREGAVDYQRVLDSQREKLESANRLIRTQSSATTSLIALYKALGGGWELRVNDPVVPDAMRNEMQRRTNWAPYFSKPKVQR